MKRRVDLTTPQTLTMSSTFGCHTAFSSFSTARKAVAIRVVQMHVEGLQAAQHREADPAGGSRAHMHALDIIVARDTVGDVLAALHHRLVGGNVVRTSRGS